MTKTDPLYELLLEENITEFNNRRAKGERPHLAGCVLRGRDLRGLIVDGLDMSDAYLRGADLRGIDFRNCNLEGASLAEAKISGCYFPKALSADEIRLSIEKGTRLRYNK